MARADRRKWSTAYLGGALLGSICGSFAGLVGQASFVGSYILGLVMASLTMLLFHLRRRRESAAQPSFHVGRLAVAASFVYATAFVSAYFALDDSRSSQLVVGGIGAGLAIAALSVDSWRAAVSGAAR